MWPDTRKTDTTMTGSYPRLDTLLAAVDSIARHTMLLSINEAVKTAQAELAGRDLTIAFEPGAVR